MIVAIATKAPSGKTDVEEFREAATVTAAITAFVNEYSPPKTAADYVGIEMTGTLKNKRDNRWRFDHDIGAVIETLKTDLETAQIFRSKDGTKWKLTITDAGAVSVTAA